MTAASLFLDLEADTASYSAARHPPLTHYRAAEGRIHDVVENGLILGLMPFASYQSKVLTLGSGDRIPLCTDCVIEADQRVKEFGEERVKRTLSRPLSAQDLCRSLGAEVSPWSQGTAHDDVTMVAGDIA